MPCLQHFTQHCVIPEYITNALGKFLREFTRLVLFILDSAFFLVVAGTAVVIPVMYAVTESRRLLASMHDMVNIYAVSGAIFVVISAETLILMIGIYGLVRKWEVYIGLKAAGLMVVLVIEFFILYSFYDECENNLAAALSMAVQHYKPNSLVYEHIDDVQIYLHCCGSSDPSDYNIANKHFSDTHVPLSCCSNSHSDCYNITGQRFDYDLPITLAYSRGCFDVIENDVKPYFLIWGALIHIPGLMSIFLSLAYCALVGKFPYPETDEENQPNVVHVADLGGRNIIEDNRKTN